MESIKINDEEGLPDASSGRLIVEYLKDNKDGATAADIYQFMQEKTDKSKDELLKTINTVLADGTTLGFLERKGSRFMNWVAREMCGRRRRRRRRRSGCRRRRRRRRRRKSCCC